MTAIEEHEDCRVDFFGACTINAGLSLELRRAREVRARDGVVSGSFGGWEWA